MMCDILPVITRLGCVLQSTSIDLSQLHMLVSSTIRTLKMHRTNPGFQLDKLDADLKESLSQSNISVTPDMKRQFHTQIFLPFIDALSTHIQERLPDTGVFAAFAVLDPSRLPTSVEEAVSQKYGDTKVDQIQQQYGGENGVINGSTLKPEWNELRCYVCMHCRSLSMLEILQLLTKNTTLHFSFPNFSKLAEVCLTLPIHTADCERAFSTMRRVKSRLRSETKNETLNHCMPISIEGPPPLEEFDFDSAVERWSNLKQRRIMT